MIEQVTSIETVEIETPRTAKQYRRRCVKLRLLQQIHAEIASKINAMREAQSMFQGKDDKYIPFEECDLVALDCMIR